MPTKPFRQLAALMLSQGWPTGPMEVAVAIALDDPPGAAHLVSGARLNWPHSYPPSEAALAAVLEDLQPNLECDLPPIVAAPAPFKPAWTEPLALPDLPTPHALAAWLEIDTGQLQWLADCFGRLSRDARRQGHYQQIWLRKRDGRIRLVEAPLPRLKSAQRRLLSGLIGVVPPHPDSFGFVRGRDCRAGAARHAGEEVVVRFDLADFFPSVRASRIHALFRTLGYTAAIARLLTGLTTTRAPPDVADALPVRERATWRNPHLPQGAPTSPGLANLAARGLDVRLAALARRMGANYSRYADDLTLSGARGLAFDRARPVTELVAEIVRGEGFRLNENKTRVQHRGSRQTVTGLVVNNHLNIRRRDWDRLKAILTNCLRFGPSTQNRTGHPDFRAWLSGRVSWAIQVNPDRAKKLVRLLDQIDWAR